jgi:hypothetical protein
MSRPLTARDIQRVTFVESLHNSLKKQTAKALADYNKFIALANSYIQDGLDEKECIELLMIDGLSREAAEGYTTMVQTKESGESDIQDENLAKYSFKFEDENGMVLSSYDIGKIIRASNDEEAWTRAEEVLNNESDNETQRLLSIHRID